jgi:hypothetical protein
VEELVKRLAVLRANAKLADVFDKRPSKAEFKMNCAPGAMMYSME